MKIGPTGSYPEGKIHPRDEGQLKIAMGIAKDGKTVVIAFGTLISWIGFGPAEARELGKNLIDLAEELEKQ